MVRGLCPKTLSNMAPCEEMWVGSESFGGVQHDANQGCNLMVFRGHYPVVPVFFSVKLPHKRLNRGVVFLPWDICLGMN